MTNIYQTESKQMNINDLTIKQAREIAAMFGTPNPAAAGTARSTGAWAIGGNYLIRTVTFAYTGKLVSIYPTELVLERAAWIADTGRFAQAVEAASFSEVEPYPEDRRVIINRGAIVDAVGIDSLPRAQK